MNSELFVPNITALCQLHRVCVCVCVCVWGVCVCVGGCVCMCVWCVYVCVWYVYVCVCGVCMCVCGCVWCVGCVYVCVWCVYVCVCVWCVCGVRMCVCVWGVCVCVCVRARALHGVSKLVSMEYINNRPTRCNTKQSISYSASSLYMFGCQPHPSSGVHKTVTTAYSTVHIFVQLPPSNVDKLGNVGGR